MCGRYVISPSDGQMQDILEQIARDFPQTPVHTGEIFPTERAPVLVPAMQGPLFRPFVWGFPSPSGKGTVINARAESLEERALFRKPFALARCIVPASGFFEWSHAAKERQKYLFRQPGQEILYLAGLCWKFSGVERFVIVTAAANDSMSPIHSRMPLFLRPEERADWLHDVDFARLKLRAELPALERRPV